MDIKEDKRIKLFKSYMKYVLHLLPDFFVPCTFGELKSIARKDFVYANGAYFVKVETFYKKMVEPECKTDNLYVISKDTSRNLYVISEDMSLDYFLALAPISSSYGIGRNFFADSNAKNDFNSVMQQIIRDSAHGMRLIALQFCRSFAPPEVIEMFTPDMSAEEMRVKIDLGKI